MLMRSAHDWSHFHGAPHRVRVCPPALPPKGHGPLREDLSGAELTLCQVLADLRVLADLFEYFAASTCISSSTDAILRVLDNEPIKLIIYN